MSTEDTEKSLERPNIAAIFRMVEQGMDKLHLPLAFVIRSKVLSIGHKFEPQVDMSIKNRHI